MYRKTLVVLACLVLFVSCGKKNPKGYFYDNQRMNYVRLEKFRDSAGLNINQPYTFTESQISTALKMVEIKKGIPLSSGEKQKRIFDSYSINKLTPPIVKAFQAATPEERVGFAFVTKSPKFILRNDRLTSGWMWVEDGKLHIKFDKIYVKLTGDTDKRGIYETRQIQRARGLRVTLDLQPGQEYGVSTDELVVDPAVITKIAEERAKLEKELAEKGIKDTVRIKAVKDKSVRERIRELDALRKERLITQEEYQMKKKELLDQL